MTLTITNNPAPPGLKNAVALDTGRLTIGRAPDNDWVLPDPSKAISRHHCVIEEHQGHYRLYDTSHNGVFINTFSQPVGQGNFHTLRQDDLILIGGYKISVALDPAVLMEKTNPTPTCVSPRKKTPVTAPADKPAKLRGGRPGEDRGAVQSDVLSDITCPVPAESDAERALREILLGAGLDPDEVAIQDPAATLRLVGEALRIVVAGVIDLLKARAAVKREFGVEQTQIRAIGNNPLKFSLSVEETLKMLLGGPQQGYLQADEALKETFADLKMHQMAVLAGTREVWQDLFKRFDPQALEQRIGEDRGLQGLLGSKKVRCWDAYTLFYQTLLEEVEDNRENLLVRKFAKAYGEQAARADPLAS